MKIKKHISKILLAGILMNNLSVLSDAGTLSPDTRYETFEGSSIKIDDILEEEKVDVEVEGNTLVNRIDYATMTTSGDVDIDYNTKEISFSNTIVEGDSTYTDMNLYCKPNLKVGETYTVVLNVLENTMSDKQFFYIVDGWDNYIPNESIRINHGKTGIVKEKFTVKEDNNGIFKIYLRNYKDQDVRGIFKIKDLMILEGDWTNKETPYYFEGIKSAGEQKNDNHSIEIKSQNKNILPNNFINKSWIEPYRANARIASEFIPYKRNTSYTVYGLDGNAYKDVFIEYSNEIYKLGTTDNINIVRERIAHSTKISSVTFTPNPNYKYMAIYTYSLDYPDNYVDIAEISVCEGDSPPLEYIKPESKDFNINLREPLRGLPSGVKDRITKRNGQWVVERNCDETILDGSEKWSINSSWTNEKFLCAYTGNPKRLDSSYMLADKFISLRYSQTLKDGLVNKECLRYDASNNGTMYIFIPKAKLETPDTNGLEKWLSKNPVKVVYQLKTPVYEPLNINNSVQLFKETTHISSNTGIPVNFKIIIDRVVNRAKEFSEAAKLNPTAQNLSQARYWINLMDESALKDEFQENLSNIIDVSDVAIEKKVVSANADIYIKSKNTLSLSLDTNNIMFENFNGTESIEKTNAVNLTVSSSLPYMVKAYLEGEIQNSNKSSVIDKSVLNIKANNDTTYKSFIDTTTPVVLLDNQVEGSYISHGVDFKLSGGLTHKADVYKTTIKFEVEQK